MQKLWRWPPREQFSQAESTLKTHSLWSLQDEQLWSWLGAPQSLTYICTVLCVTALKELLAAEKNFWYRRQCCAGCAPRRIRNYSAICSRLNSLERKRWWSWTYSQVRGIHPLLHYTGEKRNGNINCEGFLYYNHKFIFHRLCSLQQFVFNFSWAQKPSCFSALYCTCGPRQSPIRKKNK